MVGGRREGSGRRTAAGAARSAPLPSPPGSSRPAGVPPLLSPCPSGLPGAAPCPGDPRTGRRGASSNQERPLRAGAAGRSPGAGARGRSTAPRTFPFFGLRRPTPRPRGRAAFGPPRRGAAGTAVLPHGLRRCVRDGAALRGRDLQKRPPGLVENA